MKKIFEGTVVTVWTGVYGQAEVQESASEVIVVTETGDAFDYTCGAVFKKLVQSKKGNWLTVADFKYKWLALISPQGQCQIIGYVSIRKKSNPNKIAKELKQFAVKFGY